MTATPALPFDEAEIRAAFDTMTFQRGRQYAVGGAVRGLELGAGGHEIFGRVQGGGRRPYRVQVTVSDGRKRRIVSYCSCPVGSQCKHGVALMLAALRTGPQPPPIPKAARPQPPPDPLAGPVGDWLSRLGALAEPEARSGPAPEQVIYLLTTTRQGFRTSALLLPRVTRRLKAGGWGAERDYSAANLAASNASFIAAEDRLIGRLMGRAWDGSSPMPDDPDAVDLLLERVLATGRCHWQAKDGPVLRRGIDRTGELAWRLTAEGAQLPVIVADGVEVLAAASPWYADPDAGVAGRLTFPWPRPVIAALLEAPPVEPAQAPLVREALATRLPAVPAPAADVVEELRRLPPRPVLTLYSQPLWAFASEKRDLALLRFDYDGIAVDPADRRQRLRRAEDGRILVIERQPTAERAAERLLGRLGLKAVGPAHGADKHGGGRAFVSRDGLASDWWRFVHEGLPQLREAGWSIIVDTGFQHRVLDADADWDADLGQSGNAWFALDLGVMVEGERVSLLPVLAEALRRLTPGQEAAELADAAVFYARLKDGRVLALPADRVRPMLATLVELFDAKALSADGRLDVSLSQALALAEHEATLRLRWVGAERLAALADRLRRLPEIGEAAAPPGLRADLRPYQRHGLAWLQFIAGLELGGILADEMGLGKTVQTLAHILTEKTDGRLTTPALVVCPTSLVANWRHEAERFAPELRVLTLHGADRAQRFAAIAEADLVLTTYALLQRDAQVLHAPRWHLVVLDEAQAIKNPASKTAQHAVKLDAGHRLCLTGTPIENHLGELWSQMSFLVPGLLGEQRRFSRAFRTPVEKLGDQERRLLLSRRIQPFLLRRTKAEVESQLPPKTEILQRIELTGDQRDLYETVRLAMHEKVRAEIAAKGFARSQIIILEALLKLRQVCCDPRLVKLSAATKVKGSAKLAQLMEMLPELIETGRRVLLFSQFTSMLDLIVPELARAGIEHVELRGDTEDRARPVARFQDGEVPLFLLSLKAGGVGLNLTAADTVILYDPWWNPAVEAQAIDRAHRIGQDKPVFVYKLIAEGTIEDRMLALQERKRDLARGVLDEAAAGRSAFGEADLQALLAPLR
ncbi:MAG: DEAD/DEAH box helicase [Geminicoccaceae bacterium]